MSHSKVELLCPRSGLDIRMLGVHYRTESMLYIKVALKVAMTRARASIISIGDRKTLTAQASEDADEESKVIWKRLLEQCKEISVLD